MSKTSKIRRLKRQVESLKKDLCIEKFTNKLLIQDSAVCPKQFRIEQPPELRSTNYNEEQRMNRLMRYIYRQIEKEIQMCYDLDPYCDHTKLEFELFLDHHTLYDLRSIVGFYLFELRGDDEYFRGHKIIPVNTKDEYVRLMRSK